ncbi:MAG: hypothetical protein ABIP64_11490 [Burkholderiales bacterium]
MSPLRVYLDSSDYSVLSNPRKKTTESKAIAHNLRGWLADGKIRCYFSGTHLSEMAPVDAKYAESAQQRTDLMVDFCGGHALISQDRLFEGELGHALRLTNQPPAVYSEKGDWFPSGIDDILPDRQQQIPGMIEEAIQESGLNRADRRKAERKALRNSKPRAELKATMLKNARTGSLDEILASYPMRRQDARILAKYVVGDATSEQALAAFMQSLQLVRETSRGTKPFH